jgi:hypothetical protein
MFDLSQPRDTPSRGTDAGSGSGSGCRQIFPFSLGLFGMGSLAATFEPALGGPETDLFVLELFGGPAPLATGTFDLSKSPDNNFSACRHCVAVRQDLGADGTPQKWYFQAAGRLALDSVEDPPTPRSAGTMRDLKLVEVTIDPQTYISTPVPGGACLLVDTASWDTTGLQESTCRTFVPCTECCRAFHYQGSMVEWEATYACACKPATCQSACSASYCADYEPSAACRGCLDEVSKAGGACAAPIEEACKASPDCEALRTCFSTCP